ncbi:AMP-binding protein [Nocardia sp. NPDC088792]|uniref:AMP-binding protein n=1 Tax=Nocardia sp. NPDC088792 TaxID=3364332 RepID=UPI003829FFE1
MLADSPDVCDTVPQFTSPRAGVLYTHPAETAGAAPELMTLLRQWNDTSQAVALTLPQLLIRAAAYNPEAAAVVSGAGTMTYRELAARVNRLARKLIERGIGPEDVVAVAMPRSPEWVVAVCAVAHAGAAFLSVDPDAPAGRLLCVLADSDAAVGITTAEWRPALPKLPGAQWQLLETGDADGADAPPITDADRVRPLRLQHPAYVVYPAVSSGKVLGAKVTHAGLANLVVTQAQRCDSDLDARVLAIAAPGSDAAVWELLLALGSGATLVQAPVRCAGADLYELLAGSRITHAALTPHLLATLPGAEPLPELRLLATSGAACPPRMTGIWSAGRSFVSGYGWAETTVCATVSRPLDPVGPGHAVSIGGPAVGTRCYVLDEWLSPVPPGVIGDLYVAGPGVARGYHRGSGATAHRFVSDPFTHGDRMFRTGELASWRGNGELDHHGRA